MSKVLRSQKLAFMKEIIRDEDKLAYYLLRQASRADFRIDENSIKRFPYDFQYFMDCIKEEDEL